MCRLVRQEVFRPCLVMWLKVLCVLSSLYMVNLQVCTFSLESENDVCLIPDYNYMYLCV